MGHRRQWRAVPLDGLARHGQRVRRLIRVERGRVEAAICQLMTDEEGAEMRARTGELRKAAAECTGEGRSSHPGFKISAEFREIR
jgi:hypothetical protein